MVKAVVAGASGGIGQVLALNGSMFTCKGTQTDPEQPLSLLLKNCQLVDELALYDVVNTPGVAADLSHISTPAV